ncbi:MAG: glucoamylase family protein, partial [Opitutaceae bacterium]
GRTFINCPPLFTHQYSHAWFDFHQRQDAYTDYWRNSVDATLAQRQWSAKLSDRFSKWSLDLWGLTSSDSVLGYMGWGGPNGATDELDGTIVPCAPGGSLPFAPAECLASLHRMKEIGGDRVWQRYGFVDAFNPQTGWVAEDVIAIDQGIMLMMAENLRTGLVWRFFMQAHEVQEGLRLAGFKATSPEDPPRLLIATVK